MTTKQIAQDVIEKLPDEVSLYEIARRIEFVAAIQEGIDSLDRGEGIPIEEVEKELPSWITK